MTTLKQRLAKAVQQDNTIMVSLQDVQSPEFKSSGFTTEYMQFLGLTKSDLKKLEKKNLASRSYTKNFWMEGDTMPNGKVVQKGHWFTGKGHRVRWLLIMPYIPTPSDTIKDTV